MKKQDYWIFTGLKCVVWLIFVALCIEAGALLVNFVYSIFRPEIVKNLYQKLDLSALYQANTWVYYGMYGFVLFLAIQKVILFYSAIQLTIKLNIEKPFSTYVANKIAQMSYITFSIGLIGHIGKELSKNMIHHGYATENLNPFWVDSQAYILMSAVVFVIAKIFKNGVSMQIENELTV